MSNFCVYLFNVSATNHWSAVPLWRWAVVVGIAVFSFFIAKGLSYLALCLVRQNKQVKQRGGALALNLKPGVQLIIWAAALTLAFEFVLDEPTNIDDSLAKVTLTILTVAVFQIISGIVRYIVDRHAGGGESGDAYRLTMMRFYHAVIQVLAWVFCVVTIFNVWGLNVTGVITGLGVGGLAVSLAAQSTLSNLLSGILIMTDHSFAVGDIIRTPEIEGTVECISFRSSKVRTFDQGLVNVPNSKLSDNFVTNISQMQKRRILMRLRVATTATSAELEELIIELRRIVDAKEEVIPDQIRVVVEAIEPGAIVVLVQFFLNTVDYEMYVKSQQDVLLAIWPWLQERSLHTVAQGVRVFETEEKTYE